MIKKSLKLASMLMTVLLAASVFAQNNKTNSDKVSDARFAKIDRRMNKLVEEEKWNGGSGLIFKDGKEIYYNGWGYADRENKNPVKRDTIFRIYSMSKPITSVAVMQLVEQGKIDLDKPVSTYLPELADLKVLEKTKDGKEDFKEVKPKRAITTRDLLRHTAGLTYGFFGNTEVDKRYRKAGVLGEKTIEDTVKKLGKLPLLHHPGTRFHYSVSCDVLGRLVEVVSETRFDNYLKQHIFKPLKMEDTFFVIPREKRKRFAKMYALSGNGLRLSSPLRSRRYVNDNNLMFSGGGGLCSTIDDYLTFSRMLLNRGELNGSRLLKSATIKEMFRNHLDTVEQNSRAFQFGLGFAISANGDRRWGGAAGTRFWINPKQNMIAIFMMQINPGTPGQIGNEFRRLAAAAVRSQ